MRRPQFQFRVTVRAQAGEIIVAAGEQVETAERLGVAAIQAFGQPHHCRQRTHFFPHRAGNVAVAFV